MSKTTTTTTCTALTIIANPTHTARAIAAHARHITITPETITPPDTRPAHIVEADRAAYVYSVAQAAAAVCLRARDHASGQKLIQDLRRMWGRDHAWSAAADMSTAADLYRRTAAQQREDANEAQHEADKLTRKAYHISTSAADRDKLTTAAQVHADHAARLRAAASDNTKAAQDIDARLQELSASDRADIVHEAAAAALAALAEGDAENLFPRACKAAGRAIDKHRAARAEGYRTKVQRMGDTPGHKATAAENAAAYEAWTAQHPGAAKVPFNVRGGMSAGYITAEHRNSPKYPDGFYLVRHYVTPTPAPLDEAMNLETPTAPELLDVQAITAAANFPARQRCALQLLTVAAGAAKPTTTDPKELTQLQKDVRAIIHKGLTAVVSADKDAAERVRAATTQKSRDQIKRRHIKRRAKIYAAAMLDEALTIAGVPASQIPAQRADLKSRLFAAIEQQRKASATAPAPAAWASIAADIDAASAGAAERRAAWDAKQAAENAAWRQQHTTRHPFPGHMATVGEIDVKWSTRYNPAEAVTVTPDTAAEEAARAAREAARQKRVMEWASREPEYPYSAGAASATRREYEERRREWLDELQTMDT